MSAESIAFPHLGILFEHVGKSISVFGFSIAYYGLIIGCAILICIAISSREAVRLGKSAEVVYDLALYGIIVGIACARIYYVIFRWDDYKGNLLSILNLRQGGLAIYGGVIGAVLSIYIYSRVKKESFPLLCDIIMTSFVLGQVLGRWGNFFNREAFGEYTDSLFAMRLPLEAVNRSHVTELMMEHMQVVDGIECIQVHPTFLYESVWNLCLFVFILWFRKRKKFDGEIILIYLAGYGVGRFLVEGLRTDQLILFGTGIPVSQLLAAILAVGAAAAILILRKRAKKAE